MDILISNAVPAASFAPGVSGVASAPTPTAAPTGAANAGANAGAPTSVQISGLGQFLSATSTFQSQLAALQPGSASSGLGNNFGTDFGSFAAEAQNFVDAFNQVQTSLAGLPNVAQAGQFAQALNNQVGASLSNTNGNPTGASSGFSRLGDIGMALGNDGRLHIDMKALTTAFNADPAGAFSLLSQAVNSFESLAGTAQTGSLQSSDFTSLLNALQQLAALQAELSLFNAGNNSTLNLGALLALGAPGLNGTANNGLGQFAAISQFALVSSLLTTP